MEIFTNAPRDLDYSGTKWVGDLGLLRIVSVGGTRKVNEVQLLRYKDRGYFATFERSVAVAFVTLNETIEHPTGEHGHE